MARNIGCLVILLATVVSSIGVLVLWLLATLLGAVAATGPLADLARAAGLVVLVAGALALIFGLRLLRSVGGPLGNLVDAAGRIQQGDLSARVEEPRGPRDLRDVSRAFNTMASGLESEDERRRRLLADLGHELRTPLTIIQGHLEAMLDGLHPPDAEHLGIVLDETHVLERLIGDLRTLSLADAGTLPLHKEPTDVGQLLRETALAFEPRARDGDVRIVVDAASAGQPVDVDPVRLREVLGNLVENALRYSPRGSAVTLAGQNAKGTTVLTVTDEGPGLPEDLRDGVFERFTKTPESPGSGLGLAIARAIVEAHRGTIEAATGANGGTTMRITLPAPATVNPDLGGGV